MAEDTYTIERCATIDAPPSRVYEQIADFHNWTKWSPWEGIDPELKRTYSGAPSGIGAVYEWSGNRKAGEGRMEITSAAECQVPGLMETGMSRGAGCRAGGVRWCCASNSTGGTRPISP